MTALFHPCQFGFGLKDFRIEGAAMSGGRSLSGIEDPIRTDGGGYVVAEFGDGEMIDRAANMAWRALTTAMDGGATAVTVVLCDRRHQPVGAVAEVPHSDDTPFSDGTEYVNSGAEGTTTAAAALRATSLTMTIVSGKPLIGGEWFSIDHATWGDRAYNVIAIDGATITFRPPLREAIAAGTTLNFDQPRCKMRLATPTSNAISGRVGAAAISFVEDMRRPA